MTCPSCHAPDADQVVDSRTNDRGTVIRRRRACGRCQARFTTYETVTDPSVWKDERERAKAIAGQLRDMASALEIW
jgi:transcriptional repressor NrdR